jgi:hypothetical protein
MNKISKPGSIFALWGAEAGVMMGRITAGIWEKQSCE